jgi:lyso-ornithine lipid O-acyltransferase
MYYLITLLIYLSRLLDFLLMSLLTVLLSLLPGFVTRFFFKALYRQWSLSFVRVFGLQERIHHRFSGKLPEQYIMISNHPSAIEVIWLPGRFNVRPLSKDDVKRLPLIGRITRLAGVLFVDRSSTSSRNASVMACTHALEQKDNVLIFPEGGCYGKSLNPFHGGAFTISHRTKVPVLPVYVHYDEEDTFAWDKQSATKYILGLFFRPVNRTAHLYIYDAFYPESFASIEEYREHVFAFYKSLEKKYRYYAGEGTKAEAKL